MKYEGLTIKTARKRRSQAYNSDDIAYLRGLLDEILNDLRSRDGRLSGSIVEKELERRIASALFECAEPGDRDSLHIKRIALERVV